MATYAVWDWDGTLADTYHISNSAYAYTFEKLGMKDKTISFSEVKRITSSMQNKDVLGHIFGDKKDKAKKYFYEYTNANHAKDLEPIDGMRAILEYCHKKGVVSHLLSNKTNKYLPEENREPYLTQEVEKLEVKDFFKNIVGAGEFEEDKPAPVACYAVFGGKDNLPKAKDDLVIVIGDGEADLKVAEAYKQAGIKTVSILYDTQKKYNGKTKPDYIIDSLNTIPIIINNEKNGLAKVARIQMNQYLNKTR